MDRCEVIEAIRLKSGQHLFKRILIQNVSLEEMKVRTLRGKKRPPAIGQIIDHRDVRTIFEQEVDEMGSNKSGTAGNDCCLMIQLSVHIRSPLFIFADRPPL
jgi:hypothetical protein